MQILGYRERIEVTVAANFAIIIIVISRSTITVSIHLSAQHIYLLTGKFK